jgi:hypothetical protein
MCDGTQAPAVFAVSAVAIGGAVFSSVLILKVQLSLTGGFISSFVCKPPLSFPLLLPLPLPLPLPPTPLPYLTLQGKN